MQNRGLLAIIGGIVAILALVGMFVFGQITNPPRTQIFVTSEDLLPGDVINPNLLQVVEMRSPNLSGSYLTVDNVESFGFAIVADQVFAGQFIPLASLVSANTAGIFNRVALAVSDDEHVAMPIPVSPESAPQNIVIGDYVDVVLTVGAGTFLAGNFDTIPAPDDTVNEFYFEQFPADLTAVPTLVSPFATPVPTPTAQQPISLPVSKLVVTRAKVLNIMFDEIINPSFSADGDSPPSLRADLRILVVEIPRDVQEIVYFGIHSGTLNISVLHPDTGEELIESPGMAWEDLIAFFRYQRDQWAQEYDLEGIQDAPGAAAIQLSLQAPTPTSIQVFPSATSESAPEPVEAATEQSLTVTPTP